MQLLTFLDYIYNVVVLFFYVILRFQMQCWFQVFKVKSIMRLKHLNFRIFIYLYTQKN